MVAYSGHVLFIVDTVLPLFEVTHRLFDVFHFGTRCGVSFVERIEVDVLQ